MLLSFILFTCFITLHGGKKALASAKVHLQLYPFIEDTKPAGGADSSITTCSETCPFSGQHSQTALHIKPTHTGGLIDCPFLVWLSTFQQLSWPFKIGGWKEWLRRGTEESREASFQKQRVCVSTSFNTFCLKIHCLPWKQAMPSAFAPLCISRPVISYVNRIRGLKTYILQI